MTRKHYNDGFEGPPLEAGITWFDPGQSIDARSDETEGLGPKGESDGALQAQAPEHLLSPSNTTTIGERQAIAEAIKRADDAFGYSFNMTSLVDGIATHTLTMDRFEPVDFEDRDDGYRLIEQRRNGLRADAILALATPTTNAPVADQREAITRIVDHHVQGIIADYARGCDYEETNKSVKAIADAILALRQTLPIHGEMREALERIAGSWTQFNDEPGNALASGYKTQRDMMQQIARNALQGDGR